jgi:acyl transferase domain-containing protein
VTAATGEQIAIVGMAGRFPGAPTLAELWRNLRDGVESIRDIPSDELLAAGVTREQLADPRYVKRRGTLEEVGAFDAALFRMTAREAELADPQLRLFLECAWTALEDAGNAPGAGGRVGVFGSASLGTYLMHNLYPNRDVVESAGVFQLLLGNSRDFLATQTAYRLNLTGPAVSVQTACSSSLVAVHLACQSLIAGECDVALAGGVSVVVPQATGYRYEDGGIMSPDGHVRPFDHRGGGIVNGEGVGIVVLRRLTDALADGHTMRAVVRGTAVGNDGASKLGFTAPSVAGQVRTIREALAVAEVDPASVTYVEAHGTGTALGDPIEIAALNEAFRTTGAEPGSCAIGSVKANLGHLDVAAGIAGLIKTVLMLEHRTLLPSLHFEAANPELELTDGPFRVSTDLREWPSGDTPRRAGVSSFGIGGTNAHVVLEEAPPLPCGDDRRPSALLVLSARTAAALDESARRLALHLREHPEIELPDVAHTLQVGRAALDHRRALVVPADGVGAAAATLEADLARSADAERSPQEPAIVFMLSGQGSQHVGMARDLYRCESAFRVSLDVCADLLQPSLDVDLRDVLYGEAPEAAARLRATALAQPALFAVEYALAQLWSSWGVRPHALVGHSVGELVAACLAGVFSLEDALELVAERGRLMQQSPDGVMLAVHAPEHELAPLLELGLSLAAVNTHKLCTLSGPPDAVAAAEGALDRRRIPHTRLHTSHAFHSSMIEPAVAPFAELVARVGCSEPQIPYLSNVTGSWATAELATDPDYWGRQLRETVRFAACLDEVAAAGPAVLVEVGPGATLAAIARDHLETDRARRVVASLPGPHDGRSSLETALEALGSVWTAGVTVDWDGFSANERRRRVPLPTYPFARERYWVDAHAGDTRSPSLAKAADVADWFWLPTWARSDHPATPSMSNDEGWRIVFCDNAGIGDALVSRLAASGASVVTVVPGDRFSERQDGSFTVRPATREDYAALLAALRATQRTPHTIIHLWSLTPDEQHLAPPPPPVYFDELQALGFLSLVHLAGAVAEVCPEAELRVLVVSNGLHDLSGAERSTPEKTTLLGPCKVWPQEQPHVSCRSVDVSLPPPHSPAEDALVERLLAEAAAPIADTVVAYRGARRWTQSFAPYPLARPDPPRWRRGGVHLIVGGLGGVGLLVAEHLARTAQAKLALVGRSRFPDRGEWSGLLTELADDDPTSRRIRRLTELEELGAEVAILPADAADEDEMRGVIADVETRFSGLDSISYAAAAVQPAPGDGLLRTLSPLDAEAQFRPKVHGLYVLDRILRDRELDQCVLFSSIASVLGGLGAGPYAASNLFMDAFATAVQPHHRTPWLVVGWDLWQRDDPPSGRRTSVDRFAMAPPEALDALDRVVSEIGSGHVVVSTGDLRSRERLWLRLDEPKARVTVHARPELATPYVAPRSRTERLIGEVWESFLGFGPVGVDDNFFDLGGHSLLAAQVVARLCSEFDVDLPLAALFEGPTVGELAIALVKRVGGTVDPAALLRVLADLEEETPAP